MLKNTRALWVLVLVSLAFNAYFLVVFRNTNIEAKALTERVGMAEWRLEIICNKGQRAQLCKYDPRASMTP